MPPVIDKELCNCCGTCANICPMDVFFGSKKGETAVITYPEECWHCGACKIDCPMGAIRLRIPLPMMLLYK
jgi:NAD-dependent dihydropyrimidine dehydrogenase PreA subunit